MADIHDAQRQAGQGETSVVVKVTNMTGAVLSLALVAGIAVWGYKTIMRDVSGVPVVRAAEGPLRVAPVDPGGRAAKHQGLSVNVVAANGTAAAPEERLVLAPPPLDLTLADVAPPQAVSATEAEDVAERDVAEAQDTPAPPAPEDERGRADILALADQIAGAAPVIDAVATSETPVVAEPAVERVSGGLGVSLRPRPRPAQLASLSDVVAQSVAAARAAPKVEVAPESIPTGTRLAQLGAFDSPDVARAEWQEMTQRFGDFIDGKQRVIQRAESGGRTFYRLRAVGFADLGEARRFCSALVAEGADCIPVVTR